jgi:hypothetical protein
MPYIPDEELNKMKSDISVLEKKVGDLKTMFQFSQGMITIRGYAGKHLVVNDNFDVAEVLARLKTDEARITALEPQT